MWSVDACHLPLVMIMKWKTIRVRSVLAEFDKRKVFFPWKNATLKNPNTFDGIRTRSKTSERVRTLRKLENGFDKKKKLSFKIDSKCGVSISCKKKKKKKKWKTKNFLVLTLPPPPTGTEMSSMRFTSRIKLPHFHFHFHYLATNLVDRSIPLCALIVYIFVLYGRGLSSLYCVCRIHLCKHFKMLETKITMKLLF